MGEWFMNTNYELSDFIGGSHGIDRELFCFSHLRWSSVFQRPQQIMSRFAATCTVWFVEEPVELSEEAQARWDISVCPHSGVRVIVPRVKCHGDPAELRTLLDELVGGSAADNKLAWYYTPMALEWTNHVPWSAVAYDCMDDLSGFRFAPPRLREMEQALMQRADVMFTGGASLFNVRRNLHANIYCVPSGVDLAHFAQARGMHGSVGSANRPHLGFFGVIDEWMDLRLIAAVAAARLAWQLVMVGPIAKISPADLPQAANINWVGPSSYADLPAYLAQWDVALMPFALNDSTRFISPTKAPEYLAGGRPVASTPVADVISRFAGMEAVCVGDGTQGFIAACEQALTLGVCGRWMAQTDTFLAKMSWDSIVTQMGARLSACTSRATAAALSRPAVHPSGTMFDHVVVGAGFAGAVLAERLARVAGKRVLVIDSRSHIGGNAFDEYDAAGIMVHRYGPHIFHTNSAEVADYLSAFTEWRPYEDRVLAEVRGKLLPMPINRTTINGLFGLDLRSDEDAAAFLAARAEPVKVIRSAEDFVVSAVGRELYDTFFRGYTLKQWGVDPSRLDRSVTARVPTRISEDDRYFQDSFQAMPRQGYTAMFARMLDHSLITVQTSTEWAQASKGLRYGALAYTGPVDGYFDHRFGKLPYRSLRFKHETLQTAHFQAVGTVNYPSAEVPLTRITEFKHLTGQVHSQTSICREFATDIGDPYYPVPSPDNQALYKRYEALADAEAGVTFLGRLASYRYYNMDQVVAQALATFRRMMANERALVAAQ
jgi:UDP-galactopyranose mutase